MGKEIARTLFAITPDTRGGNGALRLHRRGVKRFFHLFLLFSRSRRSSNGIRKIKSRRASVRSAYRNVADVKGRHKRARTSERVNFTARALILAATP